MPATLTCTIPPPFRKWSKKIARPWECPREPIIPNDDLYSEMVKRILERGLPEEEPPQRRRRPAPTPPPERRDTRPAPAPVPAPPPTPIAPSKAEKPDMPAEPDRRRRFSDIEVD